MKPVAPEIFIEVDALRVGMFVHLDGGWMSHPFPLSNFRLASDEQVMTIRSLGVAQVRWSPHQSDATLSAGASGVHTPGPGRIDRPDRTASNFQTASDVSGASAASAAPIPPAASAGFAESVESADAAARRVHRDKLAAQRTALQVCEQQFAEAAFECRKLTELVQSRPVEARDRAEALTRALIGKMLGARELCIRLLSETVGNKGSTHALNVTVMSMLMGRTFGLPEPDMLDLGLGAMLHDIGKIELPERVHHRQDHFSGAETRAYEEHVSRGVAVARKMRLTVGATLVIAQHHEHADATGFPLRLNADRMTAAARIVALVNRYDNLCNPHLPSQALTPHESLALLYAQGKSRFDTSILAAFIKMMGVYPAGSTVQLTDDRYAMVMGVNSSRPLKPRVLVHEAGVACGEALLLDLESVQGLGIRRCLKPLQLPSEALEYLAPRQRVTYFFEPSQEAFLAA